MVVAFRDTIYLDNQHDHALKKINFDLLTSPPGSRLEGGSAGKY